MKILEIVHEETPPKANTRRHVEREADGAHHCHDSADGHPTSLTSEADKSTRLVRRSTVKRAAVAMAEGLEKELSCSICTDVLYQPLTLLDCLHTFCGACLKEWFSWQASNAQSNHPYTCPSCRASVRGTKHNATVTTLLEMFLAQNPGKGKTDEEKEDMRKTYKPGDDVIPKIRRRRDPDEEEDRRLMEETRDLSLREVGVRGDNLDVPRDRHRRSRSRESRDRENRHRGARDASHGSQQDNQPTDSRNEAPARTVEHQASLRSLLSVSEVDHQEIEDDILRQITEEGLLNDIDFSNIDPSQEEEISQRIADAYKRRLRERQRRDRSRETDTHRSREQEQSNSNGQTPPSRPSQDANGRRRPPRLAPSTTQPNSRQAGPPVSRPHLFDAVNEGSRQRHRRSASQGAGDGSLSVTSSRPAARSASDLSERPATSEAQGPTERRRRLSQNDRTISDPDRHTISDQWRHGRATTLTSEVHHPNSPRRAVFGTAIEGTPPSSPGPPPGSQRPTRSIAQAASNTWPVESRSSPATTPSAAPDVGPLAHRSTLPDNRTHPRPSLFTEPSISCSRCATPRIEYDLHYNCPKCDSSNYNLCLPCYRAGKGCKNWYGFGHAARQRYERQAPAGGYPPNHEQPHVLVGQRYLRPRHDPIPATNTEPRRVLTEEDPATRLESGVFCDSCSAFANACYWKCDYCNEGAWGFCKSCVDQGRHCTHPLLPLQKIWSSRAGQSDYGGSQSNPSSPEQDTGDHLATPPITPKSASLSRGPGYLTLANSIFRPLTFTDVCDVCRYPIPPSNTRYHCPKCNNGDYDICTSCYHGLVNNGRISQENGHNGWRRCLRGHRMVVVGFEDRDGGSRRIVVRDIVGGHALKEDDLPSTRAHDPAVPGSQPSSPTQQQWSWRDPDGTVRKARTSILPSTQPQQSAAPTRFPPDGGVGLKVLAYWGYYPAKGVVDELMFPKGAEIREAENINGDWFWGVYAGMKGLFPGNYGRVL